MAACLVGRRSSFALTMRRAPAAARAAGRREAVLLPGRRCYVTRQHMDRHMARLQEMASTTAPASQMCNGLLPRYAKIVCTIGPKVANERDLDMLMAAGMNVARFNFSHGEYDWFADTFALIRKVEAQRGRSDIAIALDTKGPEIRTGQLKEGSPSGNPGFTLNIKPGDELVFSTDASLASTGDAKTVYIDYADIGNTLSAGDPMMVDDGLLEFRVVEAGDGYVRATAVNGGQLGERKGVNLPGASVTLPAVSEKDRRDLAFGAEQGVDLVFASFVRKAEHVHELRAALGPHGKNVKIISKIENLEGVQNFDAILAVSDGIMVARGDLGIEIPAPKVLVAQKLMITKCNMVGKPVICATQMLDSMVSNPRPTRAEVSDVANAIIDGSDAVMLSGETAKGAYPKEAVTSMSGIVREAEAAIDPEDLERRQQLVMPKPAPSMEAVSAAAARTAEDQGASLVMVVTETGAAPQLAAKYRPTVPIVAVCNDAAVARQCALLRGVIPIVVPFQTDCSSNPTAIVNNVIGRAVARVKEMNIASGGIAIVLHDADITDQSEMDDWVLRVVDMSTLNA
eukprot:TRINITY_DN64703_c0_g1_i1.p1 TRINITY_DN64703_c0_g1~~TRINITY_DN64703_c0_g1_i1.p1  ORF type:complete len:582 (+),score=149.83 TRINITY_DN64703_c0_g1_i1:39-1748(+)